MIKYPLILLLQTFMILTTGRPKNVSQLDSRKKLLLLPKDKTLYLHCNTGYRSKKAAEFSVENGNDQVYNLERGTLMDVSPEDCFLTH